MSTAPQEHSEGNPDWDSEQEHDGGEKWGDVELSSATEDEENESYTFPAPVQPAGVHSESHGKEEGATLEDLKDISSIQEDESYTQEDLSSVQEDASSMQGDVSLMQGDNGVSTQGLDASTSHTSQPSQPQQLQEHLLKLAQLAGLESQLSQNSEEPKNSHESQERRDSTEQDSGFLESKDVQKSQASPAQRNSNGPKTDRAVEPSRTSNDAATSGVDELHSTKEETNGETSQHNQIAGATAGLDEATMSGADEATVAADASSVAGNAVKVSQEQGEEEKTANGSVSNEQGEAQERASDDVDSPHQTGNNSNSARKSVPVEEVGLQSLPGSIQHSTDDNLPQENVTNVADSQTPTSSTNGNVQNGLKSPQNPTRPAPVGLLARLREFAPGIAVVLLLIIVFWPCYMFGSWWLERSNELW